MMKFSWAISRVKWLSSDQTSTLRTRTEMVLETLVFSLLNHLTQLIAQDLTSRSYTASNEMERWS
jgi:hypothetical protein